MTAVSPLPHHLAQAQAAFAAGDYSGCVGHCRELLRRDATHVAALHVMGCAHIRLGRRLLGVAALEAAVKLAPDDAPLLTDYATALSACGRTDDAGRISLAVAGKRPRDPDSVCRLVPLLRDGGHHDEVLALLTGAVVHTPDHVGLRVDLAMELASLLRLDEALIHLAVAEYLKPDDAAIQTNLGIILQARGDLAGAAERHRRARDLAPDSPLPPLNLATTLLTGLDLEGGFATLEHRPLPDYGVPLPPRWRGEEVRGKRLLVLAEQGLGDMIQFARFLPSLARRGAEVVVACEPDLLRLFATLPVEVCSIADPLPPADLWLPFLSLGALLKPEVTDLARSVPYLSAPMQSPVVPPETEGLKVGLVWAAGASIKPSYSGRALARRSCPLDAMAPLAALDGISLFSLQKGPAVAELTASGLPIHDLSGRLHDLADTAAAITQLDLVISVDTSVAHLTGAMGKPLWLLLAHGQADFRWGVGTHGTPWYPQARLFRATQAGWPDLLAEIAAELALAARGKGRLVR